MLRTDTKHLRNLWTDRSGGLREKLYKVTSNYVILQKRLKDKGKRKTLKIDRILGISTFEISHHFLGVSFPPYLFISLL